MFETLVVVREILSCQVMIFSKKALRAHHNKDCIQREEETRS